MFLKNINSTFFSLNHKIWLKKNWDRKKRARKTERKMERKRVLTSSRTFSLPANIEDCRVSWKGLSLSMNLWIFMFLYNRTNSCFGLGEGSSHFTRKVCICPAIPIFFTVRHDIPNKDRFRRFSKMCCCPQPLGLPASWCRAVGSSACKHWVSHHLSANRISLPQAGMRQRDHSFLFLFTQCLGFSGKVLVLCKSLSHIHS